MSTVFGSFGIYIMYSSWLQYVCIKCKSIALVCIFIHSSIHSFIQSFVQSFIQSFIHPSIHSINYSTFKPKSVSCFAAGSLFIFCLFVLYVIWYNYYMVVCVLVCKFVSLFSTTQKVNDPCGQHIYTQEQHLTLTKINNYLWIEIYSLIIIRRNHEMKYTS